MIGSFGSYRRDIAGRGGSPVAEKHGDFCVPEPQGIAMNENQLTLREALASDRLEDFLGQEVNRGSELLKGSELERALALLVTKRALTPPPCAVVRD
jgi:hypothetical protein